MKINYNTIYRYSRPYSEKKETIDGYKNFFHYTFTEKCNKPLLDFGINPIGQKMHDRRIPAILLNINPHKSGTDDSPWKDIIDLDNMYIRYSGDNRPGRDNPDTPRNITLIKQLELHQSQDIKHRKLASPIIVFKNVKVGSKVKGYKKFLGYGIITNAEQIMEYYEKTDSYFPNYVYHIKLIEIGKENSVFDWGWISDRRDDNLNIDETFKLAPGLWKKWINQESI